MNFKEGACCCLGFYWASFLAWAVVFHSEYGFFYPIQLGCIKDKLPLKAERQESVLDASFSGS